MGNLRNRFIGIAYLIFLSFFIHNNIIIRENREKIDTYDEVKARLEKVITDYRYLESEAECLDFKNRLMEEWYDGFALNVDWDKAVELNRN